MKPLLSIIIPIFNREQSVQLCIDSVLAIKDCNFELILVDDGSKDATLDICKTYEKVDKRVTVCTQVNKGVSAARNLGLEIAHGEWVAFVDSDDAVIPSHLEILKKEGNNADLLMTGNSIVNIKNGVLAKETVKQDNKKIVKSSAAHYFMSEEFAPFENAFYFIWDKFFRRDIIEKHHIRFDESLSLGEDQVFVCEYLCYAYKLVRYTNETYLRVLWDEVEHLSGRLRTPEDYLHNQIANYNSLMTLHTKKGGELTEQYAINYAIDRPITRILVGYTQKENRGKISMNDLVTFTKTKLIPFFETLDTSSYNAKSEKVKGIYKTLMNRGAFCAILKCYIANYIIDLKVFVSKLLSEVKR